MLNPRRSKPKQTEKHEKLMGGGGREKSKKNTAQEDAQKRIRRKEQRTITKKKEQWARKHIGTRIPLTIQTEEGVQI